MLYSDSRVEARHPLGDPNPRSYLNMRNYEDRFFITCRFVFASFFFLVRFLFLPR